MEFKDGLIDKKGVCLNGINRIRLEFKVIIKNVKRIFAKVLIKSDWNLKAMAKMQSLSGDWVLIESDWNLKKNGTYRFTFVGWY